LSNTASGGYCGKSILSGLSIMEVYSSPLKNWNGIFSAVIIKNGINVVEVE